MAKKEEYLPLEVTKIEVLNPAIIGRGNGTSVEGLPGDDDGGWET